MSVRNRNRKISRKSRSFRRRPTRQNPLAYETLESRIVLTADFGLSVGGVLTLDDFTASNHDVTIAQGGGGASEMTFTLANGNWNGTDGLVVTGAGTPELTVNGSLVNQVIINDSMDQDFDVTFAAVDMTSLGNGLELTGVDEVVQTGAVSLTSLSFTLVSSVTLNNAANDFDSIGGSSTGEISIVDADEVTIAGITTSSDDVKLTSGGNLDLDDAAPLGAGTRPSVSMGI